MTDSEIVAACAEVMGYEYRTDAGIWPLGWYYKDSPCGLSFVYDPLSNDEQAMALVKNFELTLWKLEDGWAVRHPGQVGPTPRPVPIDLNRAICECVIKILEERQNGERRTVSSQ